jgi:molybdopterin-containing oxidoreductase family membrane subunit
LEDSQILFRDCDPATVSFLQFLNLFLLGAEVFKEYYSDTIHLVPLEYLYQGFHGHYILVPWMWLSLAFNLAAFVLFLDGLNFRLNHLHLLHGNHLLISQRKERQGDQEGKDDESN